MSLKYKISLKAAHDASGMSAYAVAKKAGLSQATVHKYVSDDHVIADYLPTTVIQMTKVYGVDWRDSSIVEVFEEGESAPEIKTPALALA